MGFDNSLCDRQADAVAAGGGVAGFVRTVEAVEETAAVRRCRIVASVEDFDARFVLYLVDGNDDAAVIVRILDGVVDEDREHLLDGGFLAEESDAVLDVSHY